MHEDESEQDDRAEPLKGPESTISIALDVHIQRALSTKESDPEDGVEAECNEEQHLENGKDPKARHRPRHPRIAALSAQRGGLNDEVLYQERTEDDGAADRVPTTRTIPAHGRRVCDGCRRLRLGHACEQ